MRIRKRSAATSSGREPELQESGLHPHATSKSNPSPHYPTSYLTSHAGIIKQDHLLLAGSSYGAGHRPSQKQLPAEAVLFKRKPCTDVSAGVEAWHDEKAGMMQKEDENPSTKRIMNARHNEVKHMHGQDNLQSRVEMRLSGIRAEENKLSELCKKAKHSVSCRGSALMEDVIAHAHPATTDAADRPRKVRPLQLILSCVHSPTAPKFPLPLCPTSSSNTSMPCTPSPLPRKSDKTWPSPLEMAPPLTSSAGASSTLKQIAEVKSRDDMRLLSSGESSRSSSEASFANGMGNRAELESRQPLSTTSDFSSWQGHRRPRSHVQAGRGRPGFLGRAPSSVNADCTNDRTDKQGPADEVSWKKAKQINKRKSIDSLVSVQLAPQTTPSPSTAPDTTELRKRECLATESNAHSKARRNDPLLLSTSAACEVPLKIIRSLVAAGSPDAKPAATTATQVASASPEAASDHELPHDSMRCRRKDGRRWRCKAQVVMAGAPFCHYHTLKMREKHAVSVARRLSKQLQGEVKVSNMSDADFFTSSSNERANKRSRRIGTSSSMSKAAHESCKVATVNNEAEREGPDDEQELEREENKIEDAGQRKLLAEIAGKQQMQQSVMLVKRRWRKKCKPCIRRLRDIHDRASEEATPYHNKDSPPTRACSPLPECLLNTDPCEWRSDFL